MTTMYQEWVKTLSGKISLNGQIVDAKASERRTVINPATLEPIGFIALCGKEDVEAAVTFAEKAQKNWSKMKPSNRGQLLHACGQVLQQHAEGLAQLMSYETGKALRTESRMELSVIADTFSFFGGLALELKGETIPYDPNMLTFTLREPLGVVGAIIPWNAPLMLMAMKIAPALVAGNTVVLKSSPEAAFCVLKAAELMNQILPPGVLNVISGEGGTGEWLVAHPKVKKVSFTGSVESGRKVYQSAASKLIPVALELGGKSPFIVFEDADLEAAVGCAFDAMRFTRQGQSCSASSRVFVHEALHDTFVERLLERLNKMIMGDPLNEQTDVGSVISKLQFDKVQSFVQLAKSDSTLRLHFGSELPSDPHLQKGLFVRPVLITGLQNDHEICQKEIFGPVAAILKWREFDEVIAAANQTDFGLAAGVWTRDLPKALQAAHLLDAGFVQINQYVVFKPSLPFGGFKNSGIGKEASLNAMLENFTREKTVIVNMRG